MLPELENFGLVAGPSLFRVLKSVHAVAQARLGLFQVGPGRQRQFEILAPLKAGIPIAVPIVFC